MTLCCELVNASAIHFANFRVAMMEIKMAVLGGVGVPGLVIFRILAYYYSNIMQGCFAYYANIFCVICKIFRRRLFRFQGYWPIFSQIYWRNSCNLSYSKQ